MKTTIYLGIFALMLITALLLSGNGLAGGSGASVALAAATPTISPVNADRLDNQHGSYYRSATNLNAGTLNPARYSAWADLAAEGYLGNAIGDLARNNGVLQVALNADLLDGQHASAFALAGHNHDSRYWMLGGSPLTGTGIFGITTDNPLEIVVNNLRALRLEPNATSPNIIAGFSGNWLTSGVFGATISGGGYADYKNRVTDVFGTVGGGVGNQAGDDAGTTGDRRFATVGGGASNTASGDCATVGGGINNTASGADATVSGGRGSAAIGNDSTVGGGWGNIASGTGAFVGGGGYDGTNTSGNSAGGPASTIGGGLGNSIDPVAFYATIAGGRTNTASVHDASVGGGLGNNASNAYATVGGGYYNVASGAGAFVGGGGTDGTNPPASNQAQGAASTVGGGVGNIASGAGAFVGGGGTDGTSTSGNAAQGAASSVGGGIGNVASGNFAAVSGGNGNTASGREAAVSGGAGNIASGTQAAVGGGLFNTASGEEATVPGGYYNIAQGAYSFAAGTFATANNAGCFVWGDESGGGYVTCDVNNRWVARASGGVYFYTNSGLTSGVDVPAGGSAWSSVSDRNMKANFAAVDGEELLRRLAGIPISTWNYKSQDDSIRHIGPMAQDFSAAFGVGEDNLHISTVDADGVALAGVQGLYQLVQKQAGRTEGLESRVAALESGKLLASLSSAVPQVPAWVASMFSGLLGVLAGVFLTRRREKR